MDSTLQNEQPKKCKRGGCNKTYYESKNTENSCRFHPGKPIFHDIKKGWDCCGKIVYDWDEFEKIEGCCTGKCSDDVEVAGFWQSKTVANADAGLQKAEARLKTADDFNREEEERLAKLKAEREAKAPPGQVEQQKPPKKNKAGKFICANKGCVAKCFLDEDNELEEFPCMYHTGVPIFHDLKKYWSCCNPDGSISKLVAWDWDEFMLLPTCAKGKHQYKY